MFQSIVVGLDGSDGALRALPVAIDLAKASGAKLVMAHIEERVVGKAAAAAVRVDEPEIRADLERRADELKNEGVEASVESTVVVLGGPAHAIAEIASKAGADLIVVGTRGHSRIAGLLVGSVTQRLLHIANCPVLAVPPAAREPAASPAAAESGAV